MITEDRIRFVRLLALELENRDIALPSLPDVVMKIRRAIESETADIKQISHAVSVDPALTSRLLVVANSAFYNRANVKIETLDVAIGRLGFEVVRNTAMSIAMKQLYAAEKHSPSARHLRAIWARGMKLSSMAFAIAARVPTVNAESAFLCGLMHEIGKLYILNKTSDFPQLLGNEKSLTALMLEWNPPISNCIIESWGFAGELAQSADFGRYLVDDVDAPPRLVDVMYVAILLVDGTAAASLLTDDIPPCIKLGIAKSSLPGIFGAYRDKLTSLQQSLS